MPSISLVNTGLVANDGTGDRARVAFNKINANFEELSKLATATAVGLVKPGAGLSVDVNGAITPKLGAGLTLDATSAIAVPKASITELGLVKPDGTTLAVNSDGVISATAKAARYVVVADNVARLALSSVSNLTIAQQVDTGRIWYLNANLDPSVAANWVDGGSTSAGVNSFAGRTGIVTPQTGDYLAYVPAHTATRAYSSGEVVQYSDGLLYIANAAIPANTAFSEGTTGATWRKLLGLVTTTASGLMTASDKVKLDGIAAGAAALGSVVGAALGATAAAGSATTAARSDHVHPLPANASSTADGLMASADKTKLDAIASPVAADSERVLTGAGTYRHRMSPHVQANAYAAGDRCVWFGILVEANGAIAANTAFSWGTTGATWKPILNSDFSWKGVYASTSAYALGDVVAVAAGSRLYVAGAAVPASTDSDPGSGNNRSLWRSLFANTGYDFRGASATGSGQAGLVPAPAAGDQQRFLRGDGFWADATGSTIPAGMIMAYGGTTPPAGWLLCDGTSVSRTTYAALFAAIGTAWGSASASTFNLPDLRGRFLRGVDGGTGRDPDASSRTASATGGNTGSNVGSVQADDLGRHTHGYYTPLFNGQGANGGGSTWPTNQGGTQTTNQSGGNETRPKNANVNFIIKT